MRLAADRVERGGPLSRELADALADDIASHPEEVEELQGFAAGEGALPEGMVEELDSRVQSDQGGEDGQVFMDRLLSTLRGRRRTA